MNADKLRTTKDTQLKKLILSNFLHKRNPLFRNFCILSSHESQITEVLDHANLVKFRESIKARNKIYIITELVEGKDLLEYVKEK